MNSSSIHRVAFVVLILAMLMPVASCRKKPQAAQGDKPSALMQSLSDWRSAGGKVNVSDISTGLRTGKDQNAATLHQYLFEEMHRIPERDLDLLNEPWNAGRGQMDSLAKFYALTIDQIKTAANVSNCDWEVDYSRGLETRFPYLRYLRSAVRLLRADAISKFDSGDVDGAAESLKCGFLLSKQAVQGGVPMALLVGVAIEATMTDTIDKLCKDEPALSLVSVKPILTSQNLRPLLGQAILNDATLTLGEMRRRRLGNREGTLDESIDPNFSREIVEYLDSVRSYVSGISVPLYQQSGVTEPTIPASWRQALNIKDAPIDLYNRNAGWVALSRTLAEMAIELREEKLRTGHYPDPSTVEMTTDPFDGGTVKYELNPDGGFMLTSSGTSGEPAEPIVWTWK